MSGGGPLLALETSGSIGSVALSVGGAVRARRFLEERHRHAQRLPAAIEVVLDEAGLLHRDLAGIVVGSGPGSFTGVRVAAATANGLAHALGIPVWPVSSLAAAAAALHALPGSTPLWPLDHGGGEPGRLRVLFDARGDRLFTAVYDLGPDTLTEVEAPNFAHLGEVLTRPGGAAHAGDGALRHREVLEGTGVRVLEAPAGVPTADGLLWARVRLAVEPMRPGEWAPQYLRDTGAVRAREGR